MASLVQNPSKVESKVTRVLSISVTPSKKKAALYILEHISQTKCQMSHFCRVFPDFWVLKVSDWCQIHLRLPYKDYSFSLNHILSISLNFGEVFGSLILKSVVLNLFVPGYPLNILFEDHVPRHYTIPFIYINYINVIANQGFTSYCL